MNCLRSLDRKHLGNMVIQSWVIIGVIASLIGFGTGYAICAYTATTDSVEDDEGHIEGAAVENTTESVYDDLTVYHEIDTLLRMTEITDDKEKKEAYLERVEQLLERGDIDG